VSEDRFDEPLPTRPEGEFVSEQLPREGLGAGSGGYLRIIANPSFRRLWIGQVISGIGDWLVIGLLITWVQDLSNGSAFAVAGIMIAKIIPSLVYGSVLGAMVDRFDRRKLMITCDLTQMVLALLLFFTNSLWVIYLVVLMLETMGLMFYPAKNALIPKLVEGRDLAVANGLSYTTQQASMLIGLTMSGAIVAVFTTWCSGSSPPTCRCCRGSPCWSRRSCWAPRPASSSTASPSWPRRS
jgi:MFS family permease